jgi:TolB-like protein/tetratricopeptide (TPR) repeat protein
MDRANILESWKEIASYLNRNVRTCQMWEQGHGLPIHRLDGSPKAHVFAYKDELDAWLERVLNGRETGEALQTGRKRRKQIPFLPHWNKSQTAAFSVLGLAVIALLIYVFPIRSRGGGQAFPGAGRPSPRSWKNSIAVLPFEDMSADHALENRCESLTDNIATKLGSIKELRVISRRSARRFAGKKIDPAEIRRELNVGAFLEASLQSYGDQVRVNANLGRTPDGLYLWSRSYSRSHDDMLGLEDEIARDVVFELGIELTSENRDKSKRKDPKDNQDYDVFLLGRHFENRYLDRDDEGDFRKAVETLTEYTGLHPDYALAYCSLGTVYEHRFALQDNPEDEVSMRLFYEKAYGLDPDLEETNLGMGWACFYGQDFDRSYAYFKKAVALGPDNPEVYWNVGSFLLSIGLDDKGLPHYEKALAYDPLNSGLHSLCAITSLRMGEYKKGLRSIEKAIALDPENAGYRVISARLLLALQRPEEAAALLGLLPDKLKTQLNIRTLEVLISAVRKDREKALSLLRELQPLDHAQKGVLIPEFAGAYALLKMDGEAVETIDVGIRRGFSVAKTELYSYALLESYPHFESLRNLPEFKALENRQRELYQTRKEKYKGL